VRELATTEGHERDRPEPVEQPGKRRVENMWKFILGMLCAATMIAGSACWTPVQISAADANTVYVLDYKLPALFAPEGRVVRCVGNQCTKVYAPKK
jgi:hypothetical protein